MQTMPGTAMMAKKRDVIEYVYRELPRGGEVVMKTTDAEALASIHEFMEAQRMGHHATGAEAH
jgi:precorrin-6B methylase 2